MSTLLSRRWKDKHFLTPFKHTGVNTLPPLGAGSVLSSVTYARESPDLIGSMRIHRYHISGIHDYGGGSPEVLGSSANGRQL